MSDRTVTPEDNRGDRSLLPDAGVAPDDAPIAPPAVPQINVTVRDQAENAIGFVIKQTTKIGKIMDLWAEKYAVDKKTLRFVFDGERLVETDTPEGKDMDDGDIIEVYSEQIGGSLATFI